MKWPVILLALLASGCSLQNRQSLGPDLAATAGWKWEVLNSGQFDLAIAASPRRAGNILTVYIEGDGLAYLSRTEPAMDPTPTDPVALRLALRHPGNGPVVYLARPCQYVLPVRPRNCKDAYWTSARYAPEVLESADAALNQLSVRAGAGTHLVLVGYSGGGAIAALLAERRTDVVGLVTVAANLDLDRWAESLGLTPLAASLNPSADAARLSSMPQVHFIGVQDKVVESSVLKSFLTHLPANAPVRTIEVEGQSHSCCWAKAWLSLSRSPELSIIPGWISGWQKDLK